MALSHVIASRCWYLVTYKPSPVMGDGVCWNTHQRPTWQPDEQERHLETALLYEVGMRVLDAMRNEPKPAPPPPPTIAQLVARLAAADRATFAGMAEGPDSGRWTDLAETGS